MSNRNISENLKKVLRACEDDFKCTARASREELIKTLEPGQPAPSEGVIYGDEFKKGYKKRTEGYQADIAEILDKHVADLKKKATEAPSVEAVSSISLLNMRTNITRQEVEDLLERYGDNPQAYNTISNIARNHDIQGIGSHPISEAAANAEGLRDTLIKAIDHRSGGLSSGKCAFIEMSIDSLFPAE